MLLLALASVAPRETHVVEFWPARVELGTLVSGQDVDFAITARNNSNELLRIVGARTSCGCLNPHNLPITLPAMSTTKMTFGVNVPNVSHSEKAEFEFASQLMLEGHGWMPMIVAHANVCADTEHEGRIDDEILEPLPMEETAKTSLPQ